ncbi:MAG TPA: aminopeptidase P N-terminal domain-containing protein [Longimicrobiaceae bacterium]|nr:aminopeptidase P N-terminal domain-containing protein [Longimicrobiaceae bacterium]
MTSLQPATGSASPAAVAVLPPEVLRARRERLLAAIGDGVAVFCAAPEHLKSRDTDVRYRPDSDLWYLTGFAEPGTVAVLTPHDGEARLTLFVRPRDPERETWTGRRAGVEGAIERFAADAAHSIDELDELLPKLLEPADAIWYSLGANAAMDARIIKQLGKFRSSRPRGGKGPWDVRDPAALMDRWRLVKEEGEIERIRAACDLSAKAHLAAMRATRDGVGEWEVESVLDSTYRRAGGWGPSFPSIVGSGVNATILHYTTNDCVLRDGDAVLVDSGAELAMYCGDITRTYPVSGRFTPTQREVYDIVLAAEEAAIAVVRPGAAFSEIHDAAVRVLTEGLVRLGVLEESVDEAIESAAYKRFYMHQTSHWLGLDVHDAGPYRERDGTWLALEPGMVLTVEPGLYFPVEDDVPEALRGLGIRIEDDVLVTAEGYEILTRGVPVAADEVEALLVAAR